MNKEVKTSEQAKEEIKDAIKTLGGFVTDLIDEVLKLEEKITQLQQELDEYKLVANGEIVDVWIDGVGYFRLKAITKNKAMDLTQKYKDGKYQIYIKQIRKEE